MIQTVKGKSINEIFYQLLDLSRHWVKNVPRRGLVTVDSPGPVIVELTNPRTRVISITGRGASLPAQAAETLWVLGGRNDLTYLTHYLPRAPQFSDDGGKTWRDAYGPRLRDYAGHDQLRAVVDELRDHPDSRRAVMSLLIPDLDHYHFRAASFPCNQNLSFMVRDGKLDLVVFIRSQDLLWGWSGADIFSFTVLHELVSILTGIPLGSFFNVANSLHYYAEFEPRMERMREQPLNDIYLTHDLTFPSIKPCSLEDVDASLKAFFKLEELARAKDIKGASSGLELVDVFAQTPKILSDLMSIVTIYSLAKNNSLYEKKLEECILQIDYADLRLGMQDWLRRQVKQGE